MNIINISALILLLGAIVAGASDSDHQNTATGNSSEVNDVFVHKEALRSSTKLAADEEGTRPGLLRRISYKKNKDALVVVWGPKGSRSPRGRRGKVILYGPDGKKIRTKRFQRNKQKRATMPLRGAVLRPGSTYIVKLFALRQVGPIREAVLLSALEYTHPIAPSPPTNPPPTNPPPTNPSTPPNIVTCPPKNLSWNQIGADIVGETEYDWSGHSVAMSSDGTRIAIGAPGDGEYPRDGETSYRGHVRVYEIQGGSWVQLGDDIDGEADYDRSGWSVAMSSNGSRIVIGSPFNGGNGDGSGHVRVYEYTYGSWSQLGADIDGEAANDLSGWSVAMSSDGSTIAIGAYWNDGNGSRSGHVRVYEIQGDSWVQLGADIDGEAEEDLSGYSVAMSDDGTRIAIGARNNDGNGSRSGHVRVYEHNGNDWLQLGDDIDGEAANDFSGTVAMSSDGTRIAIGAPGNAGGSFNGQVRVYKYNGSGWVQLGSDIDGEAEGDWSGESVAMSSDGTRIAIGAPYNGNNGDGSGQVRVYEYIGSDWLQLGAGIIGEAEGDIAGKSVAMSSDGTRIAIGAPFHDGSGANSGHIRVYDEACTNPPPTNLPPTNPPPTNPTPTNPTPTKPPPTNLPPTNQTPTNPSTSESCWNQIGADIDGEADYDRSGTSIAMSADGKMIAIGAPDNFNDNGDYSGHVRVYEIQGGSWVQLGADINGEAERDWSGWSIAMASYGTRIAIGAPNNDGNDGANVDSGHVRVYDYDGSTGSWVQLGDDIDGEAKGDRSGHSVAMSSDGTRIAIGALLNDGNGSGSGHVRVYDYDRSTGSWVQLGDDIDGEAECDESGSSVAMSSDGNKIAIGAPMNGEIGGITCKVKNGDKSGHVRVYEQLGEGGSWVQLGDDIDGEAKTDDFGSSVAMSSDGTRIAIGAIGNDGNGSRSGHVRVYDYDGSTGSWVQLGDDIDGEAKGDRSGYSVAMSSDGTRIAIGAPEHDGNGSGSGHVRVYGYDRSTGSWVQLGSDIDGEAKGDESGWAVAMSSDGTRIAIGAHYNDGNGDGSGHVRVYDEACA